MPEQLIALGLSIATSSVAVGVSFFSNFWVWIIGLTAIVGFIAFVAMKFKHVTGVK